MKHEDALALVATYERLALKIAQDIGARKALPKSLPTAKLEQLDTALGSPEKVNAFLASMPGNPDAEAVLDAFGGTPEDLGKLLNGPLGGDMTLLAALASGGCKRDPAKLVDLANTFIGDPTLMKSLLDDCGLKTHPEAFATLFQNSCDSDPAKLKTLATTFSNSADQKKLAAALTAGGLGQSPEALGALAKDGDGATLLKVVQDFNTESDHKQLNMLLNEGGLDGRPPGRPGLLNDVLVKGLGGDTAKLKALHSEYCPTPPPPPAPNDLGDLKGILQALDGTDSKGGVRIQTFMNRVPARYPPPDNTPAAALKKFGKEIGKRGRAAGAPDVSGGSAEKTTEVATGRADPPAARTAGALASHLDAAKAGDILSSALTDPAERAAAAKAAAAASALTTRAEALALVLGPSDVNVEQTERTKLSITALSEATTKVLALTEGAAAKDIAALEDLVDAVLANAALEPDGPTRGSALQAAKDGAKAMEKALAQAAAAAMAKAGPAAGAAARVSDVLTVRAGASAAEKKALSTMSDAAMAAAAAATGASADQKKTAQDAAQAILDTIPVLDRPAETIKRNEAATSAAEAAVTMQKALEVLAPPVDPGLIAKAAALAKAATIAGRVAPDEAKTKLAFDAAQALALAIANAVKAAAAFSEAAAAHASLDASAALNSASSCDQTVALLNARDAGGGVEAAEAEAAAQAARAGGLGIAEAERLLAADAVAQKASARDAARRQAAETKGSAPDALEVIAAEKKANDDADAARILSETKGSDLAVLDVALGTAAFQTAIEEARTTAEDALRLGPLAPDDTIRTNTVTQAKDTLKQVTDACTKLAKHLATQAQTALKADQLTKANAARVSILAVVPPQNAANTKQAADDILLARDAINNVAQSMMNDLILTDPDVTTLRDAATKAKADASVPGADRMAKLKSLIAKCAADRKIAEKTTTTFDNATDAVPPVPEDPVATAAASLSNWPAPTPDTLIRTAIAASEAKMTAGAQWRESAEAILKAIDVYDAEFNAMTALSPAEVKEHTDITDLRVNAGVQRTDAIAYQETHDATAGKFAQLMTKAKDWTIWARKKNTVVANAAATDQMKDANGFLNAMSIEGVKSSLGSNFTPIGRDELAKIAATMENQGYHGPATSVSNLAGGGGPAVIDMQHIGGRHVREGYEFGDADSGPKPDEQIVGRMVRGMFEGDPGSRNAEQIRLSQNAGSTKPNSLLPEDVNLGNLLAIATEVMQLVFDANKTVLNTTLTMVLQALVSHEIAGSIDVVGPPACRVKYYMKLAAGQPKLIMLCADGGDQIMMPDMIAAGKAAGI